MTGQPLAGFPEPRPTADPACPAQSGQVGTKSLAQFQAGPPVGESLYRSDRVVRGALTVHGDRRLDVALPVSYPSLARTRVLLALQRRFCTALASYENKRRFMALHDWIRDEFQGEMTVEEFACLLVASGYCSKHLTERTGNDSDGWTCLPCEQGFPGLFS